MKSALSYLTVTIVLFLLVSSPLGYDLHAPDSNSIINLTLAHKKAPLSDFCSAKRYDSVLFIAQQTPRRYLIFGSDDLYYEATFRGHSFTAVSEGPFKLTTESPLKGLKSVAAYLATSPPPSPGAFISLLFLSPAANPNLVLQFLGDQAWLVDTGSGQGTSLPWPPPGETNCPAHIRGIINRATGPHLLFDRASYAYNLSVSGSGKSGSNGKTDYRIVCGRRSEVPVFPENNYFAMMGVDLPHDGGRCSAGIELFRWMRSRLICRGCLAHPEETIRVTLPFCDLHSQLPNRWAIFGCPDPALDAPTPSWLVCLYIFISVIFLAVFALTAYFLVKRLFHQTKDEILQTDFAGSSKIG